jgi:hypothetical protein
MTTQPPLVPGLHPAPGAPLRNQPLPLPPPAGVCQICEVCKRLGVPLPISIQNDFSPVFRCLACMPLGAAGL